MEYVPKRLTILRELVARIAEIRTDPYNPSSPLYFKTVKRAQMAVNAEKPACLIRTMDWTDELIGGVDSVRSRVRLVLLVILDNADIDGDVLSDRLEYAVALVQRRMETMRKLGGNAITIMPIQGFETALDEVGPFATTALVYDVLFERNRGEP